MKNHLRQLIAIISGVIILTVNCYSAASAGSLDKLLTETEGLADYLNQLTVTITTLTLKQEYIQSEIDDTNEKIADNQVLLDEANAACDQQYDLMKMRIRYLYESGDTNYIEAILSSESISDMLNKFEYIDNIVGYDRDMLEKYKELIDRIETLQNELDEKVAALEELRDEAVRNMNEASQISNSATNEIIEYGIDAGEVDALVNDYIDSHGTEIRTEIEQTISDKQDEDPDYNWFEDEEIWTTPETTVPIEPETYPEYNETTHEPETEPETTTEWIIEEETTTEAWTEPETTTEWVDPDPGDDGSISDYGYSDAYLIACLVSGEVGYVEYTAQWAVADLIMNRLESGCWSGSVWGVLHDPGQFDAVYWYYIPGTGVPSYLYYIQNGPLDSCLAAAYDAMGNRGASHGYQFYCTYWFYEAYPEYFTNAYGEVIGGQYFYNIIW